MSRVYDFRQDEVGRWVVLLTCGHSYPVRHRPPYVNRPWVLTQEGRAERIGQPWRCKECEQRAAA